MVLLDWCCACGWKIKLSIIGSIMLAADKLQLQSTLRQQATALKEKEFNLHHGNLMTVGTQAAVLAGLDITMFIEFQPPPNDEWVRVVYNCFRII